MCFSSAFHYLWLLSPVHFLWRRTALDEDEIYSVAQLLGDLATYRATGTGHLELLAG